MQELRQAKIEVDSLNGIIQEKRVEGETEDLSLLEQQLLEATQKLQNIIKSVSTRIKR